MFSKCDLRRRLNRSILIMLKKLQFVVAQILLLERDYVTFGLCRLSSVVCNVRAPYSGG